MGSVAKSDLMKLTGKQDRQSRAIMSKLVEDGIFQPTGYRSSLRISFPPHVVERWFPSLYDPSATITDENDEMPLVSI